MNMDISLTRTINALIEVYPITADSLEYNLLEKWIKEYEAEHNVSTSPICEGQVSHML